ncbi:toxic anion resistance protein [Sporomusa aerivorans]|uniref:toxic anion resistance protein n=1 Tax=Sporomusa aerivorans TaxID=204936 RepID=UPI003529E668
MMKNKDDLPEINLTLGEDVAGIENSEKQPETAPAPIPLSVQTDESILSEKEKQQVIEFSKKINLTDTNQLLQYGFSAQKNVSDFSEAALNKVMTKDMGQVGDILTGLTVELRDFTTDAEPRKGILGFFKKAGDQLQVLRTKYASVEANITRITNSLENHKIQLLKDISTMDKMYQMNLTYYKELTMYIVAGKARLKEALEAEAPALREKAQASGLPQDAQLSRDFEDMCNRFDKKIHDLELTRSICMQMAPQIRLVQNNDSTMVEKIQNSIINTIPLWKNHMVLAMGLSNAQKALEAQKAVTNVTNELLKKNAEMLKTSTVGIAKESERGIVDIETIKYVSQQLIATIEEVIQVQEDGKQKRRAAEAELGNIENELKQKLLAVVKK